jgi:hypothetical protein
MVRRCTLFAGVVLAFVAAAASAAEIGGDYLETRTCDVYTGPCFANSQVGQMGHQAILAWSIDQGQHEGVDVSGLKVVLAVCASDTLGYGGLEVSPDPIKSVVLVDERADEAQRAALVDFAKKRAGKVAGEVVRVEAAPIAMSLDHVEMVADLKAGDEVRVVTRALKKGDCVCSNEIEFYPPLVKAENAAPAFAVEQRFSGRGLGGSWSAPLLRSAFLGTFAE